MNIYTYVCLYTKTAGVKTGYHTSNGHISQIPGLSPTTNTLPEERIRGRRVGVLESDSDYVKLAKQGGHKGKAVLFPYISMFSSCCMITATNISFFSRVFFLILVQQDFCAMRNQFFLNPVHTNLHIGLALNQET